MEPTETNSSSLQQNSNFEAATDELEESIVSWTVSLSPEKFRRRAKCFSAVSITEPIEVQHTYSKRMVRRYPPANTAGQLQHRLNTRNALRIWRAKQCALSVMLRKQADEAALENRSMKLRIAKQRAHVARLRQLLGWLPEPKIQVMEDITIVSAPEIR